MCRYVKILVVLLCVHVSCWAQPSGDGVTLAKETVTWDKDTVWYINTGFDVYTQQYELTLELPVADGATHFDIDWGDRTLIGARQALPQTNMVHTYTSLGNYTIIINLYTDASTPNPYKTYYRIVMNKGLSTDFELKPMPFKYCIEWGGDSLLLVLKNFHNPTGTVYEVILDSKAAGVGNVADSLAKCTWFGEKKDSVWIEFLQPTGTYDCKVSVGMTYKDVQKNIDMSAETDAKKVSVYKAPDMRDIFNFPDTLQEGTEIKNFEVCTGSIQSDFQLHPDVLLLYQYKPENASAYPYYSTINDNRDFEIRYYFTEDTDEPDSWTDVTGNPTYVDTTMNIGFYKSGFYKVRVTASNKCNTNPKTGETIRDTLWSDSVYTSSGELKVRYFQVSESSLSNVVCYEDTLCMNVAKPVTIVDRNVRKKYDFPPKYEIKLRNKLDTVSFKLGKDYTFSTEIWKDGAVLESDLQAEGCDSTVVKVQIASTIEGQKQIEFLRSGLCGDLTKTFDVHIGKNPTAPMDTVYKMLLEKYNVVKETTPDVFYEKCDSFRYTLPKSLWDSHSFEEDSLHFYFEKGSRKDTVRVVGGAEEFYDFDSTGNRLNYIRIRAHNHCGWSEQINTEFYTRTKPDAVLLRDSVPENDSLCVNFNYPYYLGGRLPETYDVSVMFNRKTQVNNSEFVAGDYKTLADWMNNAPTIRHEQEGTTEEFFHIRNLEMPSCYQDILMDVYVITSPDTIIYDSIRYCSSLVTIDTKKLFKSDEREFEWADWKLNADASQHENFPLVSVPGSADPDTLHYKLSNSKGCYVGGKVLLRPETPPVLDLKDNLHRCLPDTIKGMREQAHDFIDAISQEKKYRLSVYHGAIGEALLLYRDGGDNWTALEDYLDCQDMIYVLESRNVDTAFMDKCRAEDRTVLNLPTPVLEITKDAGLDYPWNSFSFTELKPNRLAAIKEEDMQADTYSWKHLPDGAEVSGTGLYDRAYILSTDAEKAKDSLLFEVSAKSSCNDEFRDTLVVVLTKVKMTPYKDTICSNTEEYPLWDKMVSENLDENTLEWEVIFPVEPDKKGTLSATSGTGVKYTPADGVDSVRILVKGSLVGAATVTIKDTIVLKVNPAPYLHFSVDTLWTCDGQVKIDGIKSTYYESLNCRGLGAGGCVPPENPVGGWSGNAYTFNDLDPVNFIENMEQRIGIRANGLPGCADALDTVTVINPVYAKVTFKRELEEICSGDELKLDTIYNLTGKDRFTHFCWELQNEQGAFNADTSYYKAGVPQDLVQQMTLYTYKSYTCYTGSPSGRQMVLPKQVLKVIVHREPEFKVVHKYDTLCRLDNEITINRNWVEVTPSLYPDYRDSLKINGKKFTGNMLYPIAAEGKRDTLFVTVSQGKCTKWEQLKDTIFLYRLPDMITGDFTVPDVCEGHELVLPEAGTLIHPLAKSPLWTATGGTIEGNTPPLFHPTEGSVEASITLQVQPPKGCEPDRLTKSLEIYSSPELNLKEKDTICRVVGQTYYVDPAIYTGNHYQIEKVEWFRAGEEAQILKSSTFPNEFWTFAVEEQDVSAGKVELVQKVTCGGVCAAIYYDTLRLALQDMPAITVNSAPEVCQGGAIDLNGEVGVLNAANYIYILDANNPGVINGSFYSPGEFFGMADVTVQAEGLHGCATQTKEFQVKVKVAPQPQIKVENLACQQDTIYFKALNLPDGITADCSWKFGDGTTKEGARTYNIYPEDRDYRLLLTVSYGTSCQRKHEQTLTVYRKPRAFFDVPAQVGIDKAVSFTDNSLPQGLDCSWTMSDGATYTGSVCTHKFTGYMGERTVALQVQTAEGCRDTVSHRLMAVVPPVPKFSVEADSCLGTVNFINQSDSNYAQVIAWDFVNGTSVSNTWNPGMQTYKRVYRDTVYRVSLTLSNAAGEATFTVPVKMVSRLKAYAEVLPVSDHCNKLDKEIHIVTDGRADTTRVWLGDGEYRQWLGDKVSLLTHRYQNETTEALYFPLVLEVENVCEKYTAEPVAVTVYPVAVKARILVDDNYKNECYGHDRGFINKSFGFTPDGYVCQWRFEKELETNTEEKVTHLFETPGTYVVRLEVKDNCNVDADSVEIVVHGNDSLDFRWEQPVLCTDKEVELKFVQRGKAPFGDFKWTFPGGFKRTGSETSYSFPDAGEQEVKLSAVADGCLSTYSRRLKLNRSPVPMISTANTEVSGCMPLKVPFYGTNDNDEDCVALWDFKDNSFSDSYTVPDKVFNKEGVYDVTFRLTSAVGCTDSAVLPVTVLYTPEVKMELRQHLYCTADGNFVTSAINHTVRPEECAFEWWKDNERLSLFPDSVLVDYQSFFGKSVIRLKAVHKDSHCPAVISDSIVSAHQVIPKLSVVPVDICAGAPVTLENTSEYGGGNMELTLGDGSAPVLDNTFEHIYEEPGEYMVKLRVSNPEGCKDSLEVSVDVHTLPVAGFTWMKDNSLLDLGQGAIEPEVDNGGIRFSNESFYYPLASESELLKYQWDFGDGSGKSNAEEPTYVYPNNGSYEVWLYTETEYGCRDSISESVDIATVKGLYLPNAFVPAAADEGVCRFQPKGIGLHSYQIRIFAESGLCVWISDKLMEGRPAEFWDGTYKGQPLPKGVYTWEVSAVFIDGTVWNKVNGSVTLIR